MIPKKLYVKKDSSERYLAIVRELYTKAIDSKLTEKFSAPFVLFCATSLEYFLNDIFINYSYKYFQDERQKRYAESLITLRLKVKLLIFIPIISGNKLQWNLDSSEYNTLNEIIRKRNKIAHGKDFFQGLETNLTDNYDGFSISLKDFKDDNPLLTTKKDCDRYLKAIESFIENIYEKIEKDELSNSSLTIPIIKKANKIEQIKLKK